MKNLALISIPGYGHSLLPGALPTLAAALEQHQINTTCYFLCAEFSDLLMRRHPELVDTDRDIAQWVRTYHEVYFYELIKKSQEGKTLFPLPDGFSPSGSAKATLSRSVRVRTYCATMLRFLKRRAKEIVKEGHGVVGFSCSQNSQFYTALFVALEILRHAPQTRIVFGGGLFDAGNAARFALAFPMISAFVARDGVDFLLKAVTDAGNLPRSVIGPPPQKSIGWPTTITRTPKLASILLRHRGYFQLVVSASRGCSWAKCKFCSHAVRERLSYLEPADISSELKWLNEHYGITGVVFGDLELNPSLERVLELTDALRDLPPTMQLWGLINSRWIGTEVFRQFRDARFTHLQCGIESLSQATLDRMRKGTTVLNNVQVMRLAHEFGYDWVFAPLLEGFSGETEQDVKDTLNVVRTIPHLLRAPVEAEVIQCFRHRGAALGSKLTADEPELGSSRWFDPDEISIESPHAGLWDVVRSEVAKASRGNAFLLAKSYPGLSRIVDGRGARVRVHDFYGDEKQVVDALFENPQPREFFEEAVGEGHAAILAKLTRQRLVLEGVGSYLCVAVRTGDLGAWEFKVSTPHARRKQAAASQTAAEPALQL